MKKDRNDERKINYACATVQGEHHKAQGIENQDNFIFQSKPEYAIMSVADGVGSQVYASEGSRSAVMAAAHALEAYAEGSIACEEIVGTLRSFYRNTIERGHEAHAGTTCIFAAVLRDKELVVGKIGDGMCVVLVNDKAEYLSHEENDFANVVDALSYETPIDAWDIRRIPLHYGDKAEVFMATDGIAGDVVLGKERECAAYFIKKVGDKKGEEANETLRDILIRWGEDGSADDKTAIVYKEQVKENDC